MSPDPFVAPPPPVKLASGPKADSAALSEDPPLCGGMKVVLAVNCGAISSDPPKARAPAARGVMTICRQWPTRTLARSSMLRSSREEAWCSDFGLCVVCFIFNCVSSSALQHRYRIDRESASNPSLPARRWSCSTLPARKWCHLARRLYRQARRRTSTSLTFGER